MATGVNLHPAIAAKRGTSKLSLNEALSWIGSRVDDIYGANVGRLDDVWIDPGTGTPRWLLVSEGRFGGRSTLIPFDDATAGTGHVWVPYERDVVRGAPEIAPGSPLTQHVEAALRAHYASNSPAAISHRAQMAPPPPQPVDQGPNPLAVEDSEGVERPAPHIRPVRAAEQGAPGSTGPRQEGRSSAQAPPAALRGVFGLARGDADRTDPPPRPDQPRQGVPRVEPAPPVEGASEAGEDPGGQGGFRVEARSAEPGASASQPLEGSIVEIELGGELRIRGRITGIRVVTEDPEERG